MSELTAPSEKRYHLNRVYLSEPKMYGSVSLFQIGRLHCTGHTVIETHTHLNWFELTVVTDGSGTIGTNGDTVRVRQGDIHLSFPGDFHDIRSDRDDPLKYNFFSFSTSDPELLAALEEITRNFYPASRRVFSDERIVYQIGNAISELTASSHWSERILESVFMQIVLYLVDDFRRSDSVPVKTNIGHPDELCFQMMNYIDTHLYNMRSLYDLSAALNYSYSYLSDLFRQVTGGTLSEYYRKRRLAAAQLLIREDTHKIGEIASLLQYSSIYTFSRAFHDQFGLSPSAYRRACTDRTKNG